ncbi:MAG: tryptophan synthase subunit alpha [Coxiella sp. (in: Bacteria)]|nr:MAG: tryptophan synthase subunit alpha [Coxiella sp. (in: g-proteobacteria)]
MGTIRDVFKDKKAYITFVTAGDGGLEKSLAMMNAYAERGVDIIEVGVPFTDPVADGPVLQAAALRALEHDVSLDDALLLIKTFKQSHSTKVVLFTYLNPLLQHGPLDAFFKEASACGVDGCLVVDLPIEEAAVYHQACCDVDIDPIYLIAPSTPTERIKLIAKQGRGMLYYACRKGVTGMRDAFPEGFVEKIAEIKAITDLPLIVGFGIANKTMANDVLTHADGFVVASLLVQTAHEKGDAAFKKLITDLDPR